MSCEVVGYAYLGLSESFFSTGGFELESSFESLAGALVLAAGLEELSLAAGFDETVRSVR